MNKIKCEFVKDSKGQWVLNRSLAYSYEEIDIIVKAATAAKTRNQRHYEREDEKARKKAEEAKNRVGFFDKLFACEEE